MLYFATTEDQFPLYGLEHVHQEIGHIIAVFREESRVEEPGSDAPSTQIPVDPTISVERRASRKEGRGLGRRRQPVPAATEPVRFPQPRSDMTGWFRPPGGMCPIYYGPPVHPDPTSQPGTSQPPADTQTQTPYQASPVSMAQLQSTPGQSSHGRSPGGTSEDWDQLCEDLSFDPDSLGDFPDPDYQPSQVTPSPRRVASSSTYQPGTAAYDFMQAAADDFQVHCAQQVPPPSSDLVMYSTPPPPADTVIVSTPPAPIRPPPADRPREDPWEAASRRILPHRYARAKKWPKFS